MKLTFLHFYVQLVFKESLQYSTDVHLVLLEVLGKDQNIIELHEHKDIEEISEHIINKSLKYCRCIC